MSLHASCIDCSTVGPLYLHELAVDCSTAHEAISYRASVACSIGTTIYIPSSSIVILCDVVSIIRNGLTVFCNSFDRDSSIIYSALALAVGSRMTKA